MVVACLVLGVRDAVGRFGVSPRPRRPEGLDLEEDGELGVVPRPPCHSDRWPPSVVLLTVHKAIEAMELRLPRECWSPFLCLVVLDGAGGGRPVGFGVAELSRDLDVIFIFLWGLF